MQLGVFVLTSESLDLEISFRIYVKPYVKVIGSRSRSQDQKPDI